MLYKSDKRKFSDRKKDWKQPYRKSRRFDRTCRCHGGCPWCEGNKMFFDNKRRIDAEEQLKEYNTE